MPLPSHRLMPRLREHDAVDEVGAELVDEGGEVVQQLHARCAVVGREEAHDAGDDVARVLVRRQARPDLEDGRQDDRAAAA